MSNQIWIVSDPHFGHHNLNRHRESLGAPDRPDEALADHWADNVHKRDVVWILGDVGMGKPAYETLAKLPGIKRLILGNHDNAKWALNVGKVRSLHGSLERNGILFTHFPVATEFVRPRYRCNVHGHTHEHKMPDSDVHHCMCPEFMGWQVHSLESVVQSAIYFSPPWEVPDGSEA